ncbi:hypothetical protein CBP51_12520 [Cellvibrio mixtus]|uniref:Uncharacterized protein n=1 Tax=Cellvibrio mixtus TaxID=39650 RepID=A0A266QCZ3_9GAMM|nr:hypothetical protein [Cellvibrio mixtus]OZY87742.1 hypothetical protein CBP51_12520 [Cellvibrio mixtus]
MSKPLIYIDQNIIGLQLQGIISLAKRDDVAWVYSKEHFAEIRRSNEPAKYLDVLTAIDAKLLDLVLDENWKITGEARLNESGTSHQHYDAYIEANKDVDFDDTLFDPFQVWVNGGEDEGSLRDLPEKFAHQILSLTSELPFDTTEMIGKVKSITPKFDSIIEEMLLNGNDIEKTRAAFGDEKGAIGSISGEKEIEKIWEIISPTMQGTEISCDQFFGFDPIEKQGYDFWPMYLGIIGCNAVLDILGFQAEKKCRKLNKIHNVRSDAGHIAMGAYCSAILSKDKRLIKRAKAIYGYKRIGTSPILVTQRLTSDCGRKSIPTTQI